MLDREAGEELVHSEHGNMPKWANGRPLTFWEAADSHERANGSVYRELEIALPRELSREEQIAYVRELVEKELGDKHAYQWAIHCPRASMDGGEQPHVHLMWSERMRDGIERDPESYFKRANKKAPELGGCAKSDRFSGGKSGTQRREAITAIRASVADLQNKHLERAGHSARVDHRSLKDQGIDREAERHLGPKVIKTMSAATVMDVLQRRVIEGERERAAREVGKLDLSGDLARAIKERKAPSPAVQELAHLVESHQGPRLDLSGDIERAKAERQAAMRERLDAKLPELGNRIAERAAKRQAEKEAAERAELEARRRAEAEAKQAKAAELVKQKALELANYAKRQRVEVAREGLQIAGRVEDVQRGPSGQHYAVVNLGRGQMVATPCPAELEKGDKVRGEVRETGLRCRVEHDRTNERSSPSHGL